MIGTAAHIRRALGCIAGAAIVGIPTVLLLVQILRLNNYPVLLLLAPPTLVGLGAAIGLEVAAPAPQTAGRITLSRRGIDLALLILLGILCGGLPMALANRRATDVAVEAAITLACLAFGLGAARTLSRWHMYDANAIRLAPFCAVLGMFYGLSMSAGATLTYAITVQPCPPHAYCIEPPAWQSYMLTTSIFLGLPIGLWLALTLWLALILARRATSQQPTAVAL